MAIPKLRFKEFNDDWSSHKLGNLATFSKGKGISKADISEDGENLCIRYGELYTTYGQVINQVVSKTNISKADSVLSKAGDVIIPASGETQIDIATASCVLQSDIILSGDLNVLNHAENGEWLAYYLSSAKKLEIAQLAQGNSVVHLYSSQLKNLKVNRPAKEEQTKIASFLSAVDEKINQLTQKHALLSQYKQGMMQKLFSQQIHFKADDGSEFGAWKHCKLKDVLISYRLGGNYSNAEMVTSYPLIKMGNLGRGSFNLDKLEYIPEDQIIDPEDLIKKNDLFFNTRNTLDLVGKVALWRGELPIAYYNSNLLRLDFENNIFMNYLFNEQKTLEKLKAIASGTTSVAAIYTKDLLKINLEIPCLEEQNKIASFLSSIDQKIEVVAQQIEQAKTWKKGLLQQMFV
ncbi:restriction endonuclease subunit S [Acinetobacter lwoffii]|nr:restriction endonuclease subunit S [Acinetobacter lwoffii]MCO8115089.1 restriction endonuclease subunit S [Acinetobacter lwoffii]